MASSYEFALFSSLRSTFDFSPSACCTTEYSTSCSEPWGFMALKNVALALAKNADAVPTVLFTPMSTLLLLVCRLKRAVLSWSGITGQLLCHLQKLVSWAQLKNPGTAVRAAAGRSRSLFLSLFLFSLSPPLSSSLLRAEKKPTRARGDVLLVIIGPGVGESVRERVIWASAERRGEKGGRGGERRAGQSPEPGERRAERVEKAARAGARSGGPRRSGRGGEVCVRRAASPGCSGGRFPSALSAEGSAPQQDLL